METGNANERENLVMMRQQVLYPALRLLMTMAFLALGFASGTLAQRATVSTPQFEVSGAYSYIRANAAESGGGFNVNGASGSFAYNFNGRFAVLADVGAYRFSGLPSGVTGNMYTYLFGPRYSFRKMHRVTPFVQGLLGGGRLTASSGGVDAGENGFAMTLGGGLDVPLHRHFAIRLIQAEYLLTRFANVNGSAVTQNSARISAGLVFRFGNK